MGNQSSSSGASPSRRNAAGGGGGGPSQAHTIAGRVSAIASGAGGGSHSQSSVKAHIERGAKTGIVQLSKSGLKEVPVALAQIQHLRVLDLSNNKLEAIPPMVGAFASLKQLHMGSNRLASLPDEMGNLKKLETLSLQHNRLSCVPDTLVGLMALKTILLSNNQLKHFPMALCELPNLDSADLSQNQIRSLPAVPLLGKLRVLELNVNQNELSGLPEQLADCPRLTVLRVQENCLPVAAFSQRLMEQSRISLIAAEGNLFQDKDFHHLDGYDAYMLRYTETQKKLA